MSTKINKWKTVQLSDIAHVVAGQSPDGKFYNQEGIGTPFLQGSAEFGAVHPICKLNTTHVTKIAPEGAILFSVRAPVGELNAADKAYCIGRGLAAIIGKEHINRSFLYQLLVFNTSRFKLLSQGSTFESITTEQLKSIKVTIPSEITDQSLVVDVLDRIDAKIARTEALIIKHERIRTGLLNDLLTRGVDEQGRLRSEETHEFKDSLIGRVPVEWEECLLEHILESSAYGPSFPGSSYDSHGNVATMRTTDIDLMGNINLKQMPLASLNISTFKNHILKAGDILVTRSGTCGIVSVFDGFAMPVLPGAFLIRLRVKQEKVKGRFVKLFFSIGRGQRNLLDLAEGAVQKNIRGSALTQLPITLPNPDEQERILSISRMQDTRYQELEGQLAKLRHLKTGLMHDLLTPPEKVVTTAA